MLLCEEKVKAVPDNGISIIFDHPVLFDSDIITIIGIQPTRRSEVDRELLLEYLVRRKGDDPDRIYDVSITFQFNNEEGRYKLAKAFVDKKITNLLSFELLNEVLKSGCTARLKGKTVEVDLATIDLMKLPKVPEIKKVLGYPHLANANTVTYSYKLDLSDTAEIVIFYDHTTGGMSNVRITYFRYVFEVDFANKLAKGKLKNWRNATALGFLIAVSP